MTQLKYMVNSFNFASAGNVSQDIKKKLMEMNIDSEKIRRVVLAVYEGEINMMIHANGGIIEIEITDKYIKMILCDNGPGIADIDLAMQSGYSTVSDSGVISKGFGAGMGFSNMKSMSDSMEVETKLGLGTTVTMTVNL
jgi:anti-sigma regulatory factor (Ser/Thr protein kinase)